MAKKCYQIWQKVAKVPKQCYQMWQNVAKGEKVAKGVPKVVQGRPTLFGKAHGLESLPAVLARRPAG